MQIDRILDSQIREDLAFGSIGQIGAGLRRRDVELHPTDEV